MYFFIRHGGQEFVFRATAEIVQPAPLTINQVSRPAINDTVVDIDRIGRIHDGHSAFLGINVPKIANIAFGAIADKDIVGAYIYPSVSVIIKSNCISQKGIALLRAITSKGG